MANRLFRRAVLEEPWQVIAAAEPYPDARDDHITVKAVRESTLEWAADLGVSVPDGGALPDLVVV